MSELIPPFDFHKIFVAPWTTDFSSMGWVGAMGILVAISCGLVGNYLILRRMALVGDAISHSVLPGIVIAFLLSGTRSSGVMFLGALAAGMATTLLIELIHKKSRLKHDAAIGIAFTSLFALGVILVGIYASKIDLDQECVLYGEIGFIPLDARAVWLGVELGPVPVMRMLAVTLGTIALVSLFQKELLVSSFDPGLATSVGINATFVHYALMCWLSIVVVSAFEAVGAILVIAMLILPGATASLLSQKLGRIKALTIAHATFSAVLGIHLGVALDCSIAAAMVVAGSGLFTLAWVFAPSGGLLARLLGMFEKPAQESAAAPSK